MQYGAGSRHQGEDLTEHHECWGDDVMSTRGDGQIAGWNDIASSAFLR